jgi:RHS repeat-associated protein
MLKGGSPTTYLYDAANQLNRFQDGTGYTTNTYDGCGNLATTRNPSNQRTTNAWDGENRLTRVILPSLVRNSFAYNGDGLRVQKQDSTGTVKHLWDGQNILLEANSSNVIQVVYTLEPLLYGNLVSQSRGGTDSFYLFDALGSTRQLVSSTGLVTDTYLYDAFGGIVSATQGTTTNPFQYIGRLGYYADEDTGTYHLRVRIYDTSTGRFMSRDTEAISLSHHNVYSYATDNPIRLVDPSGQQGHDASISTYQVTPGQPVAGPPRPWPGLLRPPILGPLPPAIPGTCTIKLRCIYIGGFSGLGIATHCGLETEEQSGGAVTKNYYHIMDNSGKLIPNLCIFNTFTRLAIQPPANFSGSGGWWTEYEWKKPKAFCDCIMASAIKLNNKRAPYSPVPGNSCDPPTCNSNYATKCLLNSCDLDVNIWSGARKPFGWDHRMSTCTKKHWIMHTFSTANCECVCDEYKVIDHVWCGRER